ncbi:hypothetical protein BSKO_07233 [Bryopsis sp. KO-2023]|nr:hypothetical protein BSKO_07233 [Bryopsis sp. KO-2023]
MKVNQLELGGSPLDGVIKPAFGVSIVFELFSFFFLNELGWYCGIYWWRMIKKLWIEKHESEDEIYVAALSPSPQKKKNWKKKVGLLGEREREVKLEKQKSRRHGWTVLKKTASFYFLLVLMDACDSSFFILGGSNSLIFGCMRFFIFYSWRQQFFDFWMHAILHFLFLEAAIL